MTNFRKRKVIQCDDIFFFFFFNGCLAITLKELLRFSFLLLLLLIRFCFPSGTIFHVVAIRNFKIWLSACLNVCFGSKSRKNWSNTMNFGYVFDANNLHSYTINCDYILHTLYRARSKHFLNICLAIIFEWVLLFPYFFFFVVVAEKINCSWW